MGIGLVSNKARQELRRSLGDEPSQKMHNTTISKKQCVPFLFLFANYLYIPR